MPATYAAAPEVASVADELIHEHHPVLADAPILYIFRYPAAVSKGRTILGRARLHTGLNAFVANLAGGAPHGHAEFGHTFFIMEIAGYNWRNLKPAAQAALVDHELCHMTIVEDEDGIRSLEILGHDVEEFLEVASRHGAWSPQLAALVSICGATP